MKRGSGQSGEWGGGCGRCDIDEAGNVGINNDGCIDNMEYKMVVERRKYKNCNDIRSGGISN